ncbi:TPA: restriction endonuclease subunit S [Citrobacter freundii]|nr:restriction endonuclease subunit S [Citrobacter freundii]
MAVEKLIVDHIDTWTTALQTRSTAGRGSSGKIDLYGIKKLRELILELAVRGKLVPQDPNDEPASELLKRIAAEKAELVKQGKIKKPKPLPEISEEEKPFVLPEGWAFGRLSTLSTVITKGTTPTSVGLSFTSSGVNFIKVEDISNNKIKRSPNSQFISFESDAILSRSKLESGDILFSIAGTIGKTCLVSDSDLPANTNQALAIIRGTQKVFNAQFILFQLNSFVSQMVKNKARGGAMPNISLGDLNSLCLVIPPATEQIRIIEKLQKLMSLCDQLEQHSLTNLGAHQQLVETLLTTLTDSQNADELAENWARISEHFDTLFTTEASIDALKQTILQLAVMGKLVPQDPNDEPVEKLLSRAKSHQQKRIENKEIQKNKKIDGVPYPDIQIPKTSSFILLNELAFITKLAGFEYTNYFSLEDAGEVPVVRAQNVKAFNLKKDNIKFISYDVSKKLNRSALSTECLLMTFIGAGIGDTCIFEENKRWHLAPNVAKIEPFSDIDSHYLNIYLNSLTGRNEIFKSLKATAQPSLSMSTIREIMVILPPLQEQKRIVKKTNELLALCDKVNHYIQSAQQTQLHLADALTDAAIN